MACAPISLRCLKNSYITDLDGNDILFSGLVITEGTSLTYLKSPYSVKFSRDMAVIVDAEKKSYSLRLSSVKQTKNALMLLLADCNCCADEDEVGNRNYLVKDETELPLNPAQGDIALFEDENSIAIFDGVEWVIKKFDSNVVSGTYAAIKNLADTSGLTIGNYYLMTNYQTVYEQPVTGVVKTGSVEPLLLKAVSASAFAPYVNSLLFPKDVIKYDINITTSLNSIGSYKGRIMERIDDRNNRTEYDHRVVLFPRWETATASGLYTVTSDNGEDMQEFLTFGNEYLMVDIKDNYIGNTYLYGNEFGNNVFHAASSAIGNKFGENCILNTLGDSCILNTFGVGCNSNTFGSSCELNNFGHGCGSNIFGIECGSNTFGANNSENTLGDNCNSNTFGIRCSLNVFGGECDMNTFGNNCSENNFGSSCEANTFGNLCGSNTFGDTCLSNIFLSSSSTNLFGKSCSYNFFGVNTNGNTLANACTRNSFGDDVSSISINSVLFNNVTIENNITLKTITDISHPLLFNKEYQNTVFLRPDNSTWFWYINNSNTQIFTAF